MGWSPALRGDLYSIAQQSKDESTYGLQEINSSNVGTVMVTLIGIKIYAKIRRLANSP